MIKLDDNNGKYIFIGYKSNSKGYKLYNLNNRNIIISKNIEFNEEVWDWNAQEGNNNTLLHNEKCEQTRKNLQEIVTLLSPSPSSTHEVLTTSSSLEKIKWKNTTFSKSTKDFWGNKKSKRSNPLLSL